MRLPSRLWVSLLLPCLCCLVASVLHAQEPNSYLTGKLPNGLSYYACQSKATPGELNFYLFQNVGGIVENDAQNGMAHYLEHMAFNATEHFPQGVMNYLRSQGIYTFNARTRVNETVYQINNIPIETPELVNNAYLILKDWCNGISLTAKDVEKERQIIIEEWRQRGGLSRKISDAIAPFMYNNTKYAFRNVIGNIEVLRKFTHEDIRKFYQQWYRPDLQCVIVIGDQAPQEIEAKIKEQFSALPKPTTPNPREEITIPNRSEPTYFHFSDPENKFTSMCLYRRIPKSQYQTENSGKQTVFERLFNTLASQRLALLSNDNREEFINASVTFTPLVRHYAQTVWDVTPYNGREKEALRQMLEFRQQIKKEGFTPQEIQGVAQQMYQEVKALMEQELLGTPNDIFEVFKAHYLTGKMESIRTMFSQMQSVLLELDPQEFNRWISQWCQDSNLLFVLYTASPQNKVITQQEFLQILNQTQKSVAQAYQPPAPIQQLINFPITPGSILSSHNIPQLQGAQEWKLSNGARMIYKYLPQFQGRFSFIASSLGGRSVIPAQDLASFEAMRNLIMKSGLHTYSRNQLYEYIKNFDFNLTISIDDYSEGAGANVATKDANNFFPYFHLVLTKQPFAQADFQKYLQQQRYILTNQSLSEMEKVEEKIRDLLAPPSPLNPKLNLQFLEQVSYPSVKRLFTERFGNAADFTFCIVGDIPEEQARTLTQQYIASLPGKPLPQREQPKPLDFSAKDKEITQEFSANIEGDIGEVEVSFLLPDTLSFLQQQSLTILQDVLQDKLFEELREKQHGTYSVNVQANYDAFPTPNASLRFRFRTERSRTDFLKKQAYAVLEQLLTGTLTPQDIKKAVVPHILQLQQEEPNLDKEPQLWLILLHGYVENGEVPTLSSKKTIDALRQVTPETVTQVAKLLTSKGKKREIVVKSIPPDQIEWVH